jgi:GTP-binding protein
MMKIKQAEFRGVFVDIKNLPEDDRPEIALVGRSNVGKSSLINKLTNRRKLAKSSSTPGKTRTINYYLINDKWHMVDLPGYGYAKVSKQERARWGRMIEAYLSQRQQLRGVLHILDIRHPPSADDIMMKEWLSHHQIPVLIIATKADKISRGARSKHLTVIRKELAIPGEMLPICFSADTGEGAEEIKEALQEILDHKPESLIVGIEGSDQEAP